MKTAGREKMLYVLKNNRSKKEKLEKAEMKNKKQKTPKYDITVEKVEKS